MTLNAAETPGDADSTTREIPDVWTFCTIHPIPLFFPYQVNELKGILLADVEYHEKEQLLIIENIGGLTMERRRNQFVGFLNEIRARDRKVQISWKV